ncbi:MAG: bactofilin family protein [Deltaproteobacteria bacterium]
MFTKSSNLVSEAYDTLIGSTATLDGDFSADGRVRIDGKINGNVRINGDLTMGETAFILGNVSANNIDTAGNIEGNVYSKKQLRLASTAKIIGDVQVEGLSIEEGGQFHGICSMSKFEKVENFGEPTTIDIGESNILKKKPIINSPQINNN